jgi:hypothetical protein
MIDNVVVMNAGNDISRGVVFVVLLHSLLPLARLIPASLKALRLFHFHNFPEKFDVAR